MASPDQQIPVSAGFQANQAKASEIDNDRGETIQNHKDDDAQETKVVKLFCSHRTTKILLSRRHTCPKMRNHLNRKRELTSIVVNRFKITKTIKPK